MAKAVDSSAIPVQIEIRSQQKEIQPRNLFNREISWLEFNLRVLEEAENEMVPLLERVRFLSISASNLDEFYMVRVARLKVQHEQRPESLSNDGLTAQEQLIRINEKIVALINRQNGSWEELMLKLSAHGVHVLDKDDLGGSDYDYLESYFDRKLLPTLTPIIVTDKQPFPFMPNMRFAIILRLKSQADGKTYFGLLPIPKRLKRFIRLRRETSASKGTDITFVKVEDVIGLFFDHIFAHYDILDHGTFGILRDMDVEVREKAEDLVRFVEKALERRSMGAIVCLMLEPNMSMDLAGLLADKLLIKNRTVATVVGMPGMGDCLQLTKIRRADLLYPAFEPQFPAWFGEFKKDCFAAIRKKDLLAHHPYQSFEPIVEFLRTAAQDPDVVEIWQTLYRTTAHSPIIDILMEAAKAGKKVTAVIELRARFDEKLNLDFSRRLSRAGVQIAHGSLDQKAHAKLCAVSRREGRKTVTYCHLGTGNYHPTNAKVYTDLSYFTADPKIGRDAVNIFTSFFEKDELPHTGTLIIPPLAMRQHILDLVEVEMENAIAGRPAAIWVKLNSLVDPIVIDALYRASGTGVSIDLIVRGICCLRPGTKGLSDHIRVKSIVGRFLEHSRVFCFANGHELPSGHAKVFISSADWMPRNFNRRMEVTLPVTDKSAKLEILFRIMKLNLDDNCQSWVLHPDGSYSRLHSPSKSERVCMQSLMMERATTGSLMLGEKK